MVKKKTCLLLYNLIHYLHHRKIELLILDEKKIKRKILIKGVYIIVKCVTSLPWWWPRLHLQVCPCNVVVYIKPQQSHSPTQCIYLIITKIDVYKSATVDLVEHRVARKAGTHPLSCQSPRIVFRRRLGSAHVGFPLTWLYEHITLATFPSFTHALKGTSYVSAKSCLLTYKCL